MLIDATRFVVKAKNSKTRRTTRFKDKKETLVQLYILYYIYIYIPRKSNGITFGKQNLLGTRENREKKPLPPSPAGCLTSKTSCLSDVCIE